MALTDPDMSWLDEDLDGLDNLVEGLDGLVDMEDFAPGSPNAFFQQPLAPGSPNAFFTPQPLFQRMSAEQEAELDAELDAAFAATDGGAEGPSCDGPSCEVPGADEVMAMEFYEDEPRPTMATILGDVSFDTQMEAVQQRMAALGGSRVDVVTMTVLFETNRRRVDLDWLRAELAKPSVDAWVRARVPSGVTVDTSKRASREDQFGNCVNIKFERGEMCANTHGSVAVFQTGKLTVAGPTVIAEANAIARFTTDLLSFCLDADEAGRVRVLTRSVVMVNSCYRVNFGINGALAKDVVFVDRGLLASYNKGTVLFKLPTGTGPGNRQHVTVKLFTSGQVIITGFVTPRQLARTYLYVQGMLQRHPLLRLPLNPVQPATPKKRGRKRKADKAAVLDLL